MPAPEEVEDARRAQPRRVFALRRAVPRERRPAPCSCRAAIRAGASPLWAQRKRAADLLAVARATAPFRSCSRRIASAFGTSSTCRALVEVLRRIAVAAHSGPDGGFATPSPFAASLLFSYVANFIYDGDAPLAERRAQALSVDQAQLRELLGEAELRELLDAEAIASLGRTLQRLEGAPARVTRTALHDLLLSLGDLTEDEIRSRSEDPAAARDWLARLLEERRAIP